MPSDRAKEAGGKPPEVDLDGIATEFLGKLQEVGKDFKEAFEKVQEDAQYRFDQELAKALAKHPELYAELRKTMRQVQKTVDKAAESFGLKK